MSLSRLDLRSGQQLERYAARRRHRGPWAGRFLQVRSWPARSSWLPAFTGGIFTPVLNQPSAHFVE